MKHLSEQSRYRISAVILGFTALITQIVLLREFLVVTYGNELVIGIVLANWMFLTGIGALIGRYMKLAFKAVIFSWGQFVLGLLPVVTLFLIDLLRYDLYGYGMMVNVTDVFFGSLILLSPFCLIAGILFTLLSWQFAVFRKQNLLNDTYAFESMGSIVGGLLINLVLIFFLSSVQILVFVFVINTFTITWIHLSNLRRVNTAVFIFLAMVFTGFILFFNIDKRIVSFLYPDQEVLKTESSPYGQLVITQINEQTNYFENGILKFNTQDVVEPEETVHYCLSQNPHAESVLVISGNMSKTISELLKYPSLNEIIYLEMNPYFIPFAREYLEDFDSLQYIEKVNLIFKDPRIFLSRTDRKFDAVILNIPDPSTAHINRYYTEEFFREVEDRLNANGVFILSLSSSGNYMSEEALLVHESVFKTLQHVYNDVLIIPGSETYYLVSDKSMHLSGLSNIEYLNIETQYVNEFYLDTNLLKMKAQMILESFRGESEYINKDYKPVTYFLKINHWLKYFNIDNRILIWGMVIFFLIVIMFLSVVNFGVFTGGYTAASAEFLLIISFQIIYGYVFQLIGLIVTVFMAGLAVGSLLLVRKLKRFSLRGFAIVQGLLALYAILLPLIMLVLKDMAVSKTPVYIIFFTFTLIGGIVIGLQYAYATRIQSLEMKKVAAKTYSADLFGSSAGALLTSVALLPLLGLIKLGYLLVGLNLIAIIRIIIKYKKIKL